ncbi:MAG: hypothetical protein ACOCX7_00275 [Bacteroidota bacterium]
MKLDFKISDNFGAITDIFVEIVRQPRNYGNSPKTTIICNTFRWRSYELLDNHST